MNKYSKIRFENTPYRLVKTNIHFYLVNFLSIVSTFVIIQEGEHQIILNFKNSLNQVPSMIHVGKGETVFCLCSCRSCVGMGSRGSTESVNFQIWVLEPVNFWADLRKFTYVPLFLPKFR